MHSPGSNDWQAGLSLQPGTAGTYNIHQEVNIFVGECARLLAIGPMAAAFLIRDCIRTMYEQNRS
jgi:hypothetical protein